MTHIFMVKSVSAERDAQRRHIISEINLLRKFEGRMIIDERIALGIARLHNMWFSSSKREAYASDN
jgi:hypothetical protein